MIIVPQEQDETSSRLQDLQSILGDELIGKIDTAVERYVGNCALFGGVVSLFGTCKSGALLYLATYSSDPSFTHHDHVKNIVLLGGSLLLPIVGAFVGRFSGMWAAGQLARVHPEKAAYIHEYIYGPDHAAVQRQPVQQHPTL